MSASASVLREPTAVAEASIPPTRAFYWSVRRELWENQALYLAPFTLAGVIVLVLLVSQGAFALGFLEGSGIVVSTLRAPAIFMFLCTVMSVTMAIVAWLYTLDSLHGERKDRSVLFWKSLPVSDTTTVLSKAFISAIVAPVIGIAVAFVLYLTTLATLALALDGDSALLANAQVVELMVLSLYLIVVGALWYAPVIGWLLFVSSWARRSPFLWALLPILGLMLAEYIALGTSRLRNVIGQRLFETSAFSSASSISVEAGRSGSPWPAQLPDGSILSILDPARFLSQPALWTGVVVAAALVAASVWMRRYREPL